MLQKRDQAHQAIGLVVVCSQFFEFAFTACAKFVLAQKDVAKLSEIKPLSESRSFKQPTLAILKELRSLVPLDPNFESKLESAVDRRHQLLHRWVLNPGWPNDPDDQAWGSAEQFATQLATDLSALTQILLFSITTWCEKFPELQVSSKLLDPEWRSKLPAEFKDIRIEKSG